jgi:excisionase family DNA binding protein
MDNPFQILGDQLKRIELALDMLNEKVDSIDSINKDKEIINIKEVSELLDLSIATIYSKVSKREIPFMKRGKRLYFSSSEIKNFIKAGKTMTNIEIAEIADSYLKKSK